MAHYENSSEFCLGGRSCPLLLAPISLLGPTGCDMGRYLHILSLCAMFLFLALIARN